MSDRFRAVLAAALGLPEQDRLALAEQLHQSLRSDVGQAMDEEAFAAELDRRWTEFASDPSVAVPWSEVRRQD